MRHGDISGRGFGRLVAVRPFDRLPDGVTRWLCLCQCGKEAYVRRNNLLNSHTKSCGCLLSEKSKSRTLRHGFSKMPEYHAWQNAISRCENPSNPRYASYGGRGIKVCAEWRDSFPAFLKELGIKTSSDHSLERLDVNKGYEPGNVRWATGFRQNMNTTRSRFITVNGTTRTLTEWCGIYGIGRQTVDRRMKRGESAYEALTRQITPSMSRKPQTRGAET